MIAGFFLQNFPIGQGQAVHDEIDDEILTSNLSKLSTNVFAHSADNTNPLSVALPQGTSFGDWHTYRMEWFPDHVSWYIDGTLIRTETQNVPTQPQQLHINLWGVPTEWGPSPGDPNGPSVGDPNFKPAAQPGDNHQYFFDVTDVKVLQLSTPSGQTVPNDNSQPSGLVVNNDAYTTLENHEFGVASTGSLLSNDTSSLPMHTSLVSGPSHGTLNLADDGTFTYSPNGGFQGTDSFSYQTTDDSGAIGASVAQILVAPTKIGATITLDFASLSPNEQVATIYSGLLGRGADLAGFDYWLKQHDGGISQEGAIASIQNIANSVAASSEAQGLYPLLANPKTTTDAQVVSYVDDLYQNLFGRPADAGGEAYWAGQVKQAIANGQPVGSFVVAFANGAQGSDIIALLNKAQVNLEYVNQQNALQTGWNATEGLTAAELIASVTADQHTVLIGIQQANNLILSQVH